MRVRREEKNKERERHTRDEWMCGGWVMRFFPLVSPSSFRPYFFCLYIFYCFPSDGAMHAFVSCPSSLSFLSDISILVKFLAPL
jgi:hypothetical protein